MIPLLDSQTAFAMTASGVMDAMSSAGLGAPGPGCEQASGNALPSAEPSGALHGPRGYRRGLLQGAVRHKPSAWTEDGLHWSIGLLQPPRKCGGGTHKPLQTRLKLDYQTLATSFFPKCRALASRLLPGWVRVHPVSARWASERKKRRHGGLVMCLKVSSSQVAAGR